MDRAIPKKRWSTKRLLTIGGILGIVLLIAASIYYTSGGSKLDVNTDRITVSEVTKGNFQESIVVNGVVLPLTTIYLDAQEGGRVEEKYVEEGAMMKAGDPILRLSNTELELQLINQQTAVFNLLTQMEIARNAAQQNMITNQNSLADAENNLIEATRVYNLDSHLYAEKAIGFQEYQSAKNLHEYQERKKKLMEQVLSEDSLSQEQQLTQAKQSYQGSQRSLDLMRQEVGELIVRAPVDGELTSLDAEIGENKNKGERLGQIDMVNGFKVQVQPDEHYIDRIYDGLTGTFSYADSTYNLKIKKIYTEVVDARFQVDMSFVGKAPTGLRRGQTLQVLLALSDAKQAILLPRGGFFEQTGGNWIFKLSKDGKTASRVNIQLGSMNPDYYEVLSGLKPGDKVITSSYDTYGNVQTLVLNK
ncbi:MAG TPA: HlyD family efflux transporter periplasmic adaptor subunit [Chitinophagaceae bacterium]|nr:HlyD family efflux transporter periplasmic adaptor subunit [Chitinophagaceae bacterium]